MTLNDSKHLGIDRLFRGIAAIPVEQTASASFRLIDNALAIVLGSLILAVVAADLVGTSAETVTFGWVAVWAVVMVSVMVFAKAGTELILWLWQVIMRGMRRQHGHSANTRRAEEVM